jgi:hypothetical protein
MEYQFILRLHTMVGVLALVSFWGAAFTIKGSKIHRLAGKIYLVSILLILISVIPLIVATLEHKGLGAALGLGFLFVMTFTAAWVAHRSIVCKRNLLAYKDNIFKALAAILTVYGILILSISVRGGSFLYGFFACTGLTLAGSMWHILRGRNAKPNWYLVQHLNGVALLFAATHASFLRFGLTKLIPIIPDTPEFNTISQTSVILFALLLRLTVGRRFIEKIARHRTNSLVTST